MLRMKGGEISFPDKCWDQIFIEGILKRTSIHTK
jgi:hypothetical protein